MSDAFKPLLAQLASGAVLSEAETEAFFSACLRGEPTPAQAAAALTAIRMRGETVGEIAACARAMRGAALKLEHPYEVIDVCGTGGDGLHTLNISTAVSFVCAGAGLKVAKHGNRAITSRSGAGDVLTALGVGIDPGLERQRRALDEANICFLFAQTHHGAMRHLSPIRQEIGFRTILNLLGPLTNPAGAKRQVVGVPSPAYVRPIAEALGLLGAERAWVVNGQGMDELTTTGETAAAELTDGQVREFTVTPDDAGLPRGELSQIVGGSPEENAAALRAVLDGAPGAYRDVVLLNAAAAFIVADRAADLKTGAALAAQVIDDGRAKAALDKLIEVTCAP
ncbi:MAG TPA: anthranilate phosphoribosyltransferase [Phenylobacterium sp.]|nr:anthranilate phosphoribosyltransferase [Phenylobacterium sp.]